MAHAGCRKPPRREQARGPQYQVNVAASTDLQRESRAAHFTAKTTPDAPGPKRASGLPGVGTVARVQGEVRNRRGPSARPESGQGASNKPKVKSTAAQREPVPTPRQAPNCNAYAERPVLSIKSECLRKMVFFGEASFRRAVFEFVAHYHGERARQGLGNERIQRVEQQVKGQVQCTERLGGILKHYSRAA